MLSLSSLWQFRQWSWGAKMAGSKRSLLGFLLAMITFLAGPVAAVAQDTSEDSIVSLSAPCGDQIVRIAAFPWPSAQILAHVHAQILKAEFGCETEVVRGNMAGTLSAMSASRQPALAPEMWISRVASTWNATIESRRVRAAAPTFVGGKFEGWFIPQHLSEESPNVFGFEGFVDVARQQSARGEKIQFFTCPLDWACHVINRHMIEALGLENHLEIIVPDNRFDLDSRIAVALSNRARFVFYYWQPNALVAQFDGSAMELPAFDEERFVCFAQAECIAPEPSGYPFESVSLVSTDWLMDLNSRMANYLLNASMPFTELNAVLQWQAENGADAIESATYFVREREEIWQAWLN